MTVRRESVAKAILKKTKLAEAKHGVAKASRKGPRKQVHRTAFSTRVFGTAQMSMPDAPKTLAEQPVHFQLKEEVLVHSVTLDLNFWEDHFSGFKSLDFSDHSEFKNLAGKPLFVTESCTERASLWQL